MNYKIAICEDEPQICEQMKKDIAKCFEDRGIPVQIYGFFQPQELLNSPCLPEFCVCFLDIEMDPASISGIQLARILRTKNSRTPPVIIFISNREDLVYESLKEQPLRFIRKSHFKEEIGEAVEAVIQVLQAEPEILHIRQGNQDIVLPTEDILYIESQNRVQIIVTKDAVYKTYARLSDLTDKLESSGFLTIHRSYLVNWKAIRSLDAKNAVLVNGSVLPVSKYKAAAVKSRYHQLLAQYLRI